MEHLALIERADPSRTNGKTLHERATGRFYTHELIGRALVRQVAEQLDDSRGVALSVIDPFCGDGRLVAWLLEELAAMNLRPPLRVGLWDCDDAAVAAAADLLESTARRLNFQLRDTDRFVGDTFRRAAESPADYRVVVTNPPWELVKPDHRELADLDTDSRASYIERLRSFDQFLSEHYPFAQPRRRFAGWGTNLSRVGTEVALRLTAPGGVCGMVAPASLFADTNSEALRQWIFSMARLSHLTFFPAEARLFEAVDVPGLTFVASLDGDGQSSRQAIHVTRYDASRRVAEAGAIHVTPDTLKAEGWAIPASLGVEGWTLLNLLYDLPKMGALEDGSPRGLWAGRELDETGRRRWTQPQGSYPLLKGRHVRRFQITSDPDEFVDPSQKRIPSSAEHVRLAWRDVSRPSQKRRVQATLIQPGIVTGNSLGVAYFRDDDLPRLLALLGLMSSVPFEFQVRSRLSTGHVSLGVLRLAHVPPLDTSIVAPLAGATFDCLKGPASQQPRLEALAAQAFGLEYRDWHAMASTFGGFSEQELETVKTRWES